MNLKEKIRLLMQIAAGEVHPKALLPKKTEAWVTTSVLKNGTYESLDTYDRNGRTLTGAEFQSYLQANPQVEACIVHLLDTGVPLANSEAEVEESAMR